MFKGAADQINRPADMGAGNGNGDGVVVPRIPSHSIGRLWLNPNKEHQPDSYEDLRLEFNPLLYSYLESFLPPEWLKHTRYTKAQYLQKIMLQYYPEGENHRARRLREYRERIISNYQPLHPELYDMHPTIFFVPSFLEAINANTEESIRNIMTETHPGILRFEMMQPRFCEMLLSELDNFERWSNETQYRIMRPNTMNKYGAVLADFGLETMLQKLMENFLTPISKVYFPEVGGSTLDSHHGFLVEYGRDRDFDLGFHVDDSEVTLNVCLGKSFHGGNLFFGGVRCENHVQTEPQPEENFECFHFPGHAIMHRGCHRHGARPTTAGNRINLLLWCKSSIFREVKKNQNDSSWCGDCKREKNERQSQSVAAIKLALQKKGEAAS